LFGPNRDLDKSGFLFWREQDSEFSLLKEKMMNELKRIRILNRKISQFRLSQICRVHPSRLSLLENNLTRPTFNEAKRISEALGLLPEEIFGPDAVIGKLTAKEKEAKDQA
jgi:transcriptional regulator with XRE-family HTH domain